MDLVLADATVHAFEPGTANLLVSRFGVMFFADPVLSFQNMRRALRPGGRIAFACWRALDDNPWMQVPLQAAVRHVAPPPAAGPGAPGMFSFASEERVRGILSVAGFADIDMEAVDLSLDLATGKGLDAAVESALEVGPLHRALEGQPPDVMAKVVGTTRMALAPFQKGDTVALGASVWIATARNPH
jgi:SAM-dependent methyltransferase